MLIPLLIESEADEKKARQVAQELTEFGLKSEIYVVSPYHAPEQVLDLVSDFNRSGQELVYLVLSQGSGLAGMVAANNFHPVLKVRGSEEELRLPEGVPVMEVSKLEHASLTALKILALADDRLQKRVTQAMAEEKERF